MLMASKNAQRYATDYGMQKMAKAGKLPASCNSSVTSKSSSRLKSKKIISNAASKKSSASSNGKQSAASSGSSKNRPTLPTKRSIPTNVTVHTCATDDVTQISEGTNVLESQRSLLTTPSLHTATADTTTEATIEYNDVMKANQVWDALKQVEDYEEQFGETVFLGLVERDSQARSLLQVTSMRSERFGQVSKQLFELTNIILSSLGFDWWDDIDEIRLHVEHALPAPSLRVHYAEAVTTAMESLLQQECPVLANVLHGVMREVVMQA